jgi:hypothetical protein
MNKDKAKIEAQKLINKYINNIHISIGTMNISHGVASLNMIKNHTNVIDGRKISSEWKKVAGKLKISNSSVNFVGEKENNKIENKTTALIAFKNAYVKYQLFYRKNCFAEFLIQSLTSLSSKIENNIKNNIPGSGALKAQLESAISVQPIFYSNIDENHKFNINAKLIKSVSTTSHNIYWGINIGDESKLNTIKVHADRPEQKDYPLWLILEYGTFKGYEEVSQANIISTLYNNFTISKYFPTSDESYLKRIVKSRRKTPLFVPWEYQQFRFKRINKLKGETGERKKILRNIYKDLGISLYGEKRTTLNVKGKDLPRITRMISLDSKPAKDMGFSADKYRGVRASHMFWKYGHLAWEEYQKRIYVSNKKAFDSIENQLNEGLSYYQKTKDSSKLLSLLPDNYSHLLNGFTKEQIRTILE